MIKACWSLAPFGTMIFIGTNITKFIGAEQKRRENGAGAEL